MNGKECVYISYHSPHLRFLEPGPLLQASIETEKPMRIIGAKVLPDGDAEVWLRGRGFYGSLLWKDALDKPLSLAHVGLEDRVKVDELVRLVEKNGGLGDE